MHSSPDLAAPADHPAGCVYGGFSCGYWLVVDGCGEFHPETHIVSDDRCPCGNTFPSAGTGKFVCDASGERELPPALRPGIGTPLERGRVDTPPAPC